MKDVNLIEPAHEPSQAKLELGSFTNRAEPSWLVYNRANFEPSFFQARHQFFEHPYTQETSLFCGVPITALRLLLYFLVIYIDFFLLKTCAC
ncbi:hypothetical protein Hanom_Chr07g00583021 [Helianthus anomalus]